LKGLGSEEATASWFNAMNKIVPILFVCGLVFGTNGQDANATTNNGWLRCTSPVPRDGKAHERFLLLNERVKQTGTNANIIFVGDSITEGWEYNGKAVWKEFYEPRGGLAGEPSPRKMVCQ
jgi:hypothetical protein